MTIIDISLPVAEGIAVWEGDPPVRIEQFANIDHDGSNVSMISMGLHTGTHIDSPLHYLRDGASTNQIPLEKLIGDVMVVEISDEISVIDAEIIQQQIANNLKERILFKTRNSKQISRNWQKFYTDFVALSHEAAKELAQMNLSLVGIDAPSIAQFGLEEEVHLELLAKNIVILEGVDLSSVEPGNYRLVCLPLKIEGVEGVPARAILFA